MTEEEIIALTGEVFALKAELDSLEGVAESAVREAQDRAAEALLIAEESRFQYQAAEVAFKTRLGDLQAAVSQMGTASS